MVFLKKIWPFSFNTEDVTNLVVKTIIYVVISIFIGILIGVLKSVPVIGLLFSIVGVLVEVYTIVGLVVLFLTYFKVLK